MAKSKRLSALEATELVTLQRREPNRVIQIRYDHLRRRGLITATNELTPVGEQALLAWLR